LRARTGGRQRQCLRARDVCLLLFVRAAPTGGSRLSLHDALPISPRRPASCPPSWWCTRTAGSIRTSRTWRAAWPRPAISRWLPRSEEHTSELQSRENLVCRLLLEKKKRDLTQTGQNQCSPPHLGR